MKPSNQAASDPALFEPRHDRDAVCPNCHGQGMDLCYEVRGIPVHSCLLMRTRAEALDYPTGDLRLGFCPSCGFLANTLFDPAVHEYSARYEETQGFSECFNAFARSLAQRLIDRYHLHGKRILEIGCGKGEFLALMCELGENHGIGVDPAYVPDRQPKGAVARAEFIRDFYSPKYADLSADFFVCRHTLEHIAPTRQFVQLVRDAIGSRTDTLFFMEVPETIRILRSGAFWDIYYEHCSYFSPGSLARVFRACGFDLLDLSLEYDDQYLLTTARPAAGPTAARLPLEDDLAELTALVAAFPAVCRDRIDSWRRRIAQTHADGRRVVLWGSGSKGVAFLTTARPPGLDYIVDINPNKHGKFMPGTGQEIVSPEFLRDYRPDCVIAMNPIYRREIQADLDRLGVRAELLAVEA